MSGRHYSSRISRSAVLVLGALSLAGISAWPSGAAATEPAVSGEEQSAQALSLIQQARTLYKARRYNEALDSAERSLSLMETSVGRDHASYASVLLTVARIHWALGRLAEAERELKQVIAIYEGHYGKDSIRLSTSQGLLAIFYRDQGRPKDALAPALRRFSVLKRALGPDHIDVAHSLNFIVQLYLAQGEYKKAEPLLRWSLRIRRQVLGPDHRHTLASQSDLAQIYAETDRHQNAIPIVEALLKSREAEFGAKAPETLAEMMRLAELYLSVSRLRDAETLHETVFETTTAVFGNDHPETAKSLENLGNLYTLQGQLEKAEPLLERALDIRRHTYGQVHPEVASSLLSLADLYKDQGRFSEAEDFYAQVIAMVSANLGETHSKTAAYRRKLASIYSEQQRYLEAETLLKTVLKGQQTKAQQDHASVAEALEDLGELYERQGRFTAAEKYYRRALQAYETAARPRQSDTIRVLISLGQAYLNLNRLEQSEAFFRRALTESRTLLDAGHRHIGTALNGLANVLTRQGRFEDSRTLNEEVLRLALDTVGPDHPEIATLLGNLAVSYGADGLLDEAEPLIHAAVDIATAAYGTDHLFTARQITTLAAFLNARGEYTDALAAYRQATSILERALGEMHAEVFLAYGDIASTQLRERDFDGALESLRHQANLIAERRTRGAAQRQTGVARTAAQANLDGSGAVTAALGLINLLDHVKNGNTDTGDDTFTESYRTAQWLLETRTARALSQMATRFASGNTELSALIRKRQDLDTYVTVTDKRLVSLISREPSDRTVADIALLRGRLDEANSGLDDIARRLEQDFPDFAQVGDARARTLAETQNLLKPDEAIILYVVAPERAPLPAGTFAWVVTKDAARWQRLAIAPDTVAVAAQDLRKGLADVSAFEIMTSSQNGIAGALDAAGALYRGLLAPFEDLIADKHLMIVPSGDVTSVPWQMLVSAEPEVRDTVAATLSAAPWLVRRHAVTVLPSVSSFAALRGTARPSLARNLFAGIGNPVLTGPSGKDRRAAAIADCTAWDGRFQVAAKTPDIQQISALFRGAVSDVAAVKRLPPLPETAGELCGVAHSLGVPQEAVILGNNATETTLKKLDANGLLGTFKILHFATHGLVTGDFEGLAEPALVLTPPDRATPEDDGLLTASEVAQFTFDADWVILSACNTAAGESGDAEALSGLARAFFYAGARALLVSQWPVNSQAAVELTTGTFEALREAPGIGRAEALRRAMVALIDSGVAFKAAPSYWAPFMVVGEGR